MFSCRSEALVDPTAIEESVAEANLVFGLNSYRELCGLHFGGQTLTSSQLFLRCASRGAKHAKLFVDKIKEALKLDEEARYFFPQKLVPCKVFTTAYFQISEQTMKRLASQIVLRKIKLCHWHRIVLQ